MSDRPTPTKSELKLLQLLWAHGPSTVRQIHQWVSADSDVSYTTTLKQLQIMHEKGLVSRETSSKAHLYTAEIAQDETQQSLLGDFLNRVYRGSAAQLVVQALGISRPASQEELEEIEAMIRNLRASGDSQTARKEEEGNSSGSSS